MIGHRACLGTSVVKNPIPHEGDCCMHGQFQVLWDTFSFKAKPPLLNCHLLVWVFPFFFLQLVWFLTLVATQKKKKKKAVHHTPYENSLNRRIMFSFSQWSVPTFKTFSPKCLLSIYIDILWTKCTYQYVFSRWQLWHDITDPLWPDPNNMREDR